MSDQIVLAFVDMAINIGTLIAGIFQDNQAEKDYRNTWVPEAARLVSAEYPGKNVMVVYTDHDASGLAGVEKRALKCDCPTGTSLAYVVYIFDEGKFTLKGDGGYLNWGFTGEFDRQDNIVNFRKTAQAIQMEDEKKNAEEARVAEEAKQAEETKKADEAEKLEDERTSQAAQQTEQYAGYPYRGQYEKPRIADSYAQPLQRPSPGAISQDYGQAEQYPPEGDQDISNPQDDLYADQQEEEMYADDEDLLQYEQEEDEAPYESQDIDEYGQDEESLSPQYGSNNYELDQGASYPQIDIDYYGQSTEEDPFQAPQFEAQVEEQDDGDDYSQDLMDSYPQQEELTTYA